MVLKRVGVLSVGKILGAMYAVLGLVEGAFVALISLLGASMGERGGWLPFGGLGIAAIILFPLIAGVLGFIFGIITAALYNVFAGVLGGIEMELQ
jgi:hypothetical protein